MLQLRPQAGDERRWFNPERDMAYALRRTLVTSLKSFDNYEDTPECSKQEMCDAASQLASVIRRSIEGGITLEEIDALLKGLKPAAADKISKAFMFSILGEFRVWCDEVRPRTLSDGPVRDLSVERLEAIAEDFARASRN